MSEEGKTPVSPTPAEVAPHAFIPIEAFRQIVLRVGTITAAQDHPNADRLLVLTVDVGESAPRQIVAGIKGSYQAADLVGKQVAVVTNLKPALLRGVESQGMVLAASDGASMALLVLERPLPAGSSIK